MEIDFPVMTDDESDVVEAMERDEGLLSGKVAGLTHEEVMEAARRALNL